MDVSLAMPDIASMSMYMSQNKVMTELGTQLLAKTLDDFQTNGNELTKMMELSVNPEIGGNIDISL